MAIFRAILAARRNAVFLKDRFESDMGTNPEELIAAAIYPPPLSAKAAVTLDPDGQHFRISQSALILRGNVPNLDESKSCFQAAQRANNLGRQA